MLDPAQEDQVLEMVADRIADHLIQKGDLDDLILLSPSRVGGIVDVTPRTLDAAKIPKVDLLGNGKTLRYRLSDIRESLNEKLTK